MLLISPLLVHPAARPGIAGMLANLCLGIFHCLYRSSLHQMACSHFPPKPCGIAPCFEVENAALVVQTLYWAVTGFQCLVKNISLCLPEREPNSYSCGSSLWALGCSASTYVFLPHEESVKLYPLQTLLLESCHNFSFNRDLSKNCALVRNLWEASSALIFWTEHRRGHCLLLPDMIH